MMVGERSLEGLEGVLIERRKSRVMREYLMMGGGLAWCCFNARARVRRPSAAKGGKTKIGASKRERKKVG